MVKPVLRLMLVLGFSLFLACGSTNRLKNYSFRDQTMAAEILTPPQPQVFTDSDVGIDKNDPIGSILRVGTTIAKEVEAAKAKARLDSAMQIVNVPELLKERALRGSAKVLRSHAIDNRDQAEFVFNLEIQRYGIDAKSWTSATYFRIDLIAQIFDQRTGALAWKRKFKEKQPMSTEIFGLGATADNVISAIALSNLSVDKITKGFEHLADYTADRVVAKLQKDFTKNR